MHNLSAKIGERAFTLVEVLLVLTVFGMVLAVIMPQAKRAYDSAKYSEIRHSASEVAGYVMIWAENQALAQNPAAGYTLRDFLVDDIPQSAGAGIRSTALVGKYTGDPAFSGVAALIASDQLPRNPFNQADYFQPVNDDDQIPSRKPGLLYFTAGPDPADRDFLNFFFLYTGTPPGSGNGVWYGNMDHEDPGLMRHGIFVTRLFNDQDPGAPEVVYPAGGILE